MSDTPDIIPYLRRFMSMVDPLDGQDDGKVDKAFALRHIKELMSKSAKGGCRDMHHFLQHLYSAVSSLKSSNSMR